MCTLPLARVSVLSQGHEGDRWQRSTRRGRSPPLGSTAAVQGDRSLRGFEYQRGEIRPNKRALWHSLSRSSPIVRRNLTISRAQFLQARAPNIYRGRETTHEFLHASRERDMSRFDRKIDCRTTLSRIWRQTCTKSVHND